MSFKLENGAGSTANEADSRIKRSIQLASAPMQEAGAEMAKAAKKSFFSDSAQSDVSGLLKISAREVKRVDLRDIQGISKDEEEKIVNGIKEKLQRQSAGVTIAKYAHALTRVSEEMYEAAEQLFDFGADGVALDQVLDFRFSSSVYQAKLSLPGVYQQYFDFYYKISQLQDISQYKKTSTSRADRPDILKTRILGIDANSDRVKAKEQEILLILNKFAPQQLSQILSALKALFCELSEYSRDERASLFKALFSQLYDKACLEHAFIGLYSRVMWSVTLDGGAFGSADLDIYAIYADFRSSQLLREITIGKTFLAQYQHSDLDSALASMYKQNNYKLHFEGCVLFSAHLYALDCKLLSCADLLTALFTALCRDLRENEADQTVQSRIKELAKQTTQDKVYDAARELSTLMLAKTVKARFSNISLVVQALAICAAALATDEPSAIEACLRKRALVYYIVGLNHTNTDALVLFKIRYLPSLEKAPTGAPGSDNKSEQPSKDQRGGRGGRSFVKGDAAAGRGSSKTAKNGEYPITIRKWDTVTKFWSQNGLLDTVCAIYRVAVEQLSAQITKNAAPGERMHFLDVFIAECFKHGQEKLLFRQKFELLHALEVDAQNYAYDLLVHHCISAFSQLDGYTKTQYVGMIIDLCLQRYGMLYQCLQKLVDTVGSDIAMQFLVLFHQQVVSKAYSEVVDEYEDLFEQEEIDKFAERLGSNDFCAHYDVFPSLFAELKTANYSYFSQSDFLATNENQAFATTPFEDLAIYKFHRIYVGPERISATQRDALLKEMGVLQKLGGYTPIDELLYRVFRDANFELGYLAVDVFPYSHVYHSRAKFYIYRRVVEEILKGSGCPRPADFVYYKTLLQGALAQVLFSAAYNAVRAGENPKERFAAFVKGVKDLNCVNAQAAKQLLEKHRKSGDGYGAYQVYW